VIFIWSTLSRSGFLSAFYRDFRSTTAPPSHPASQNGGAGWAHKADESGTFVRDGLVVEIALARMCVRLGPVVI